MLLIDMRLCDRADSYHGVLADNMFHSARILFGRFAAHADDMLKKAYERLMPRIDAGCDARAVFRQMNRAVMLLNKQSDV